VYVASPLGFTTSGLTFSNEVLLPLLRHHGLAPLDPWSGPDLFGPALALPIGDERRVAVARANHLTAERNATMISGASGLLAVLDGSDVDSGTAAEVGFAAAIPIPIVGWRSDSRCSGDNEGSIVNLQVEYFIHRTGGSVCTGALEQAVEALGGLLGS